MPKKAFYALPAKEQDLFFDTALGHFAKEPYAQASLSSLLRDCGLAKGTFYLYFQHKMDLYEYLVETVLSMKEVYLKTRLLRQPEDFFQLFESLLRLETTFRLEHPAFHHLLSMALDRRFSPLPPRRIKELEWKRDQRFHGMLVRDQLRGKVTTEADAKLVTFLSGLMLEEFHRFVRQQMDLQKKDPDGPQDLSPAVATAESARRFMRLFRRALSSQNR